MMRDPVQKMRESTTTAAAAAVAAAQASASIANEDTVDSPPPPAADNEEDVVIEAVLSDDFVVEDDEAAGTVEVKEEPNDFFSHLPTLCVNFGEEENNGTASVANSATSSALVPYSDDDEDEEDDQPIQSSIDPIKQEEEEQEEQVEEEEQVEQDGEIVEPAAETTRVKVKNWTAESLAKGVFPHFLLAQRGLPALKLKVSKLTIQHFDDPLLAETTDAKGKVVYKNRLDEDWDEWHDNGCNGEEPPRGQVLLDQYKAKWAKMKLRTLSDLCKQ